MPKTIKGVISFLYSIWFNFHYLPFKQACKLPILLYKPKLIACKGTVIIESDTIRRGMIRLGFMIVPLYPDTGIVWENRGGKVVFKGSCVIGNASVVSVGRTGNVCFGNNFLSTCGFKMTSFHQIVFGENVLIAWDSLLMDTSFHKIKDMDNQQVGKGYDVIIIGKNNWLGSRCLVLPGTKTPDYCIFGAGSILNKDYCSNPTHILMAGNPLTVKRAGVWIDIGGDEYLQYEK